MARQLRKFEKISAIIWVFEGVWIIYSKPTFLQSLVVLIKMFPNSLAVLNQQRPGMTYRAYCFQTQLMESCLVLWFWVGKRPVCFFSLYKKQSG